MSQGIMNYTTTYKASFLRRYDANGNVWTMAIAHDTLVAKTPYKILVNEFGQVTAALSDVAAYFYVGIPKAAASAGDLIELQIGGECADVVTTSLSVSLGHSFTIDTGAVADGAADYSGAAGEFAVCATASTTSTTQDMILVPERVLSIT